MTAMIKLLNKLLILGLLGAATACQVDLDPAVKASDGLADCTVTALATAGDSLKVRLMYTAYIYKEQYSIAITDRAKLLRILMFPNESAYGYMYKNYMEKYRPYLIDENAQVTAVTGSGEQISLEFNPVTLDFESGYKPSPGERISLTATIPARKGTTTLKASATATIPDWQPQFEIVDVKRVYKERQNDESNIYTESEMFADSVAEVTLRIHDNSTSLNCYRLKTKGVSYNYPYDVIYEPWQSQHSFHVDASAYWSGVFFSSDPLLYDSQITSMFSPWQAYTTDVFTNRQFNKVADVKVQVRYPMALNKHQRFVEIELQPISPQLMNYLSVLYRIRLNTEHSYFSEFISLPSNIEGGVGIFGGIGKSTKLRIWLDGNPDPNYPE